mmetsp:Transcript_12778/g.54134  ORF Transcript_12778/g.54134 Transcript_12778/m.54134 type:complete len:401 (-) Transcript_12778:208-1410(-)
MPTSGTGVSVTKIARDGRDIGSISPANQSTTRYPVPWPSLPPQELHPLLRQSRHRLLVPDAQAAKLGERRRQLRAVESKKNRREVVARQRRLRHRGVPCDEELEPSAQIHLQLIVLVQVVVLKRHQLHPRGYESTLRRVQRLLGRRREVQPGGGGGSLGQRGQVRHVPHEPVERVLGFLVSLVPHRALGAFLQELSRELLQQPDRVGGGGVVERHEEVPGSRPANCLHRLIPPVAVPARGDELQLTPEAVARGEHRHRRGVVPLPRRRAAPRGVEGRLALPRDGAVVHAELVRRRDDDDAGVIAEAPEECVVRDVGIRSQHGAAHEVHHPPRAPGRAPDPRARDLLPPVAARPSPGVRELDVDVSETGAQLDGGSDCSQRVGREPVVVIQRGSGRRGGAR